MSVCRVRRRKETRRNYFHSPGGSRRRLIVPRPLLPCCSPAPREALPLWKNREAVTQRDFTLVFPSFLRECTMKNQDTQNNNSPEATRLDRVRLEMKRHCRQFPVQESCHDLNWETCRNRCRERGGRHHLCVAPSGPFRQMVPATFFPLRCRGV